MYYKGYTNNRYKSSKNYTKTFFSIFLIILALGVIFFTTTKVLIPYYSNSYKTINQHIDEKKYDIALKKINKKLEKKFNPVDIYYKGKVYYYKKDFFTALLYFKKANVFRKNKNINDDIIFYIGNCYYFLGNDYYPYALKYFTNYINLDDKNFYSNNLLYTIALIHNELEQYKQAENYFAKIYSSYKTNYEYLYNFSICLKNIKKNEIAEEYLNLIINKTKDNNLKQSALFLQGKNLLENDNINESKAFFEQLLELKPDSSMTYYYLGYIYYLNNDIMKTKKFLRNSLLFNSKNEEAKKLLKKLP